MHKLGIVLIGSLTVGLSAWLVHWGATSPLPTINPPEPPPNNTADVSSVEPVTLADFDGLLNTRLQGRPAPPEPTQAFIPAPPAVTLPPQLKFQGIFYLREKSLALFSTNDGQGDAQCMVGEEVMGVKVLSIESDQVKVLYQDTEFVLTTKGAKK